MKRFTLTQLLIFSFGVSFAQVGIGNVTPQATLDISASNQSTPANNDGLLIPRIDAFPGTNPGANQNSMLVYLTTTDGTDAPGFYYWDNGITTWLPFGGTATAGWELTGNAGTVNGTNFLGTTDNQALDIRTNNVIHTRFTTDGKIEVLNTGNSVYIGENSGTADPMTVDKENVFVGSNSGENVTTGATSSFHGKYSVGIGFNALNDLTIGNRNIGIGWGAAESLTTGRQNTVIGSSALANGIDPDYNVAIGYDASKNIEGDSNTAIGWRALAGANNPVLGTGRDNTAVGEGAGKRIHDGEDNVWLGKDVDEFNTDGDRNVIIGSEAGAATGSEREINGRVLIGYQAGYGTGGTDDTLIIENSNSSTPLIGGDFANDRLSVNTDVSTLTHTFTVTGTAKITELINLQPVTAPVTPAEGDIYYDNTSKKVSVWTGAAWENLN